MKNFGFLIAAYSAIWLLLSFYFINIGRKTNALEKKIELLESEKGENSSQK